ncbi:MAG: hypothetical protein WBC40_07645 [Halobacteriota archaeon]
MGIVALAVSACAIFIALFISADMQLPEIPEKRPVFKIENETVKEDLIRRGLMGEGYINLYFIFFMLMV